MHEYTCIQHTACIYIYTHIYITNIYIYIYIYIYIHISNGLSIDTLTPHYHMNNTMVYSGSFIQPYIYICLY